MAKLGLSKRIGSRGGVAGVFLGNGLGIMARARQFGFDTLFRGARNRAISYVGAKADSELYLGASAIGWAPSARPIVPSSDRIVDWIEAVGFVPALYYHPNTETVSVAGGRLTGVSANSISPALTPSASGPKVVTYEDGTTAWRSDGSEYLDVPNTFAINPRVFSVFIVARAHKHANTANYFSISFASDGTTPVAGGASFRSVGSGSAAPYLFNSAVASSGSIANKEFMVPGAQVQVLGMASRTTANGGTRFSINKRVSSALAQSGVTTTGTVGARIMGYVSSNGTTNYLDILEIAVFAGELTDGQFQRIGEYLTDRWSVDEITQTLLIDGDSIFDGVIEVASGDNVAMVITEPGKNLIPSNVRVLNIGKSGAATADLITRRDATNGWPSMKIGTAAADNIVAVQIGRNDTAAYVSGGDTAAVAASKTYTDILNYWNGATTGVVARGWKPVQFANIACDTGAASSNLYATIKANFATDVAGGTVIDLQAIVDSAGGAGRKPFAFSPDTRDGTYYQDDDGSLDTTHPSVYGTRIMGTGGDTPENGVAAAL